MPTVRASVNLLFQQIITFVFVMIHKSAFSL